MTDKDVKPMNTNSLFYDIVSLAENNGFLPNGALLNKSFERKSKQSSNVGGGGGGGDK